MGMYTYWAEILENGITDGDSIKVRIQLGFNIEHRAELRLFGIDTSEIRNSDKQLKRYGLTAKKYVADRLIVGEKYPIKTFLDDKAKGKFGRVLAKVYHNGLTKRCLNEELCIRHLALVYEGGRRGAAQKIRHRANLKKFLREGKIPLEDL